MELDNICISWDLKWNNWYPSWWRCSTGKSLLHQVVGRVSTPSTVGPHCQKHWDGKIWIEFNWFCMKCAHAVSDLCFELNPECGKPKNKLSQRFIGYTPIHGMMFIMTPSHGWLFMGWSHQTCKGDFDKSWQGTQGPSYHQHINGEPPWTYHVHPFMDDFPVKKMWCILRYCDVYCDKVWYSIICDFPSG